MNIKFRWINLFIRDILLIFAIAGLQYFTHFKEPIVFFITGMLLVWIAWQLSDLIKYAKMNNGLE